MSQGAGRVPPQNLDAERSVLGGVLLDNKGLNDILEFLKPDDFYREAHRKTADYEVSWRCTLSPDPAHPIPSDEGRFRADWGRVTRKDTVALPPKNALGSAGVEYGQPIVISVPATNAGAVLALLEWRGVPARRLGTVGGDALEITANGATLHWPLAELHTAWHGSIARAMVG